MFGEQPSSPEVDWNEQDSRVGPNGSLVRLSPALLTWAEKGFSSGDQRTWTYDKDLGPTKFVVTETTEFESSTRVVGLDLTTPRGEHVGWANLILNDNGLLTIVIEDSRLGFPLLLEPAESSALGTVRGNGKAKGLHFLMPVESSIHFGADTAKESPLGDLSVDQEAPDPGVGTPPEDDVANPFGKLTVGSRTVVDIAILYTTGGKAETNAAGWSHTSYAQQLIGRLNSEIHRTNPDVVFRLVGSRVTKSHENPTTEEDLYSVMTQAQSGTNGFANVTNFLLTSSGADLIMVITDEFVFDCETEPVRCALPPGLAEKPGRISLLRQPITMPGQAGLLHEITHNFEAGHYFKGDAACTENDGIFRGYAFFPGAGWELVATAHGNDPCRPGINRQISVLSSSVDRYDGGITGNSTHDNARAVDENDTARGNAARGYYCVSDGIGHSIFADDRFYELTGRRPISTELSFYKNKLETSWRPVDAVKSMVLLDESKDHLHPALLLYEVFFGRIADRSGAQYWSRTSHSHSWSTIASAFEHSPEGQALHGNRSNRDFVTYVYGKAFGRSPDAAGLNYWTGQLNSGAISRADLVLYFGHSPEAAQRLLHRNRTISAYFAISRKTPTEATLATYTPRMRSSVWGGVLALMKADSC